MGKLIDDYIYRNWIKENEPSEGELAGQRAARFPLEPKISIIVPVFETPESFLGEMVRSVLDQTYTNWELCIADGGSQSSHVGRDLIKYSEENANIIVKFIGRNKGIAGNSNEAVMLAKGDYVTLLDHDDKLPPFALFEVVKAINENPEADFLYSDEDKITEDGKKRQNPHFKPDWSPDTLRSYNYICHLAVFKKTLLDQTGYFQEGYDGSQDFDIVLRATERARRIVHIPKVLYHWRSSNKSVSKDPSAKMYAFETAKKALRAHLSRVGLEGEVGDGLCLGRYNITYALTGRHKVSVIIPNKDHATDLRKCIGSILERTSYKNYEIVIVENNSTEKETFDYYDQLSGLEGIKVINWDNPFNYATLNNFAVDHAKGDCILFLNNDTEVINHDWLERMLEHALRKDVGAVGAKLYYPDDTVQHGGVIIGAGGVAGHSHKHYPRNSGGYFSRLMVVQDLSAVTGACLLMRKDVFHEVGGFDEGFTHNFNDIDLCMKIRQKGYLILWTPYAELYHHESKSRGLEDTPEKRARLKREEGYFRKKWVSVFENGDPYYNPNLSYDNGFFYIRTSTLLSEIRSRRSFFRFMEYRFRKKVRDPIRNYIRARLGRVGQT